MRFRRLVTSLVIGALFAAKLCAASSSEWVEVRSPNFSVVTDAGEKRGREVVQRFEQMRAVFGSLILHEHVNIAVPLEIIAFRNASEFRQFAPLWHGKPIRLAGLFQMGEDRDFILLDLSTENPYQAVFHEYAHLLLNGNYPPTQPWFDEGFAEYYASIAIQGNRVEIGGAPAGELEILAQSRLAPVLQLFSVRHDSPTYNENSDHRSLFYAESWLVVHYLFDHKLLGETGKYFDLVENQHVAIPDAIQQAFGMPPKDFDRALERYYRGQFQSYTWPAPAIDAENYKSEKLSALKSEAILADAHLHMADYRDKAIQEFQQVLSQDADNAAAHRGLGYAYLYRQDFAHAAEEFKQAERLDQSDPRVFYYSALLSYRQAMAAHQTPTNLGEMATELHKSLQLDPSNADAYGLLGVVELEQGSPSLAAKSLLTALRIKPREEHYMLDYANALAGEHKMDDAKAIWARLQTSDDPEIARLAGQNLSQSLAPEEDRPMPMPDEEKDEQAPEPSQPAIATAKEKAPEPKPDTRPIQFLKGKLLAVDCSGAPAAVLTLQSGAKVWHMHTADSGKLVLIGADSFSCSWKNEQVAVNYRDAGKGAGDLVSVEIE
jgi:cytochrome c-type biogenesis protein CcmH/NrfG